MHSLEVLHLWKRTKGHRLLCAQRPGEDRCVLEIKLRRLGLSRAPAEGASWLCRLSAAAEHAALPGCVWLAGQMLEDEEKKGELWLVCLACVGSLREHRSHRHAAKRGETCPALSVPKREGVTVTDNPSWLFPHWMQLCTGGRSEESGR